MDVVKRFIPSGWEMAYSKNGLVNCPADCAGLSFKPASVPGTNLTDLQAAGIVEGHNSATYEDSFAPYKYMDFIYTTKFKDEIVANKKIAFLCFDGLDTVCDIFLNDEQIGSAENCYIEYRYNITGKIKKEYNILMIIFRSPLVEAEKRQQNFGIKFDAHLSSNFMFIRKPAYSFFWDWGPELPVCGIYRPVYIKAFNKAEIEEFYIRYKIENQVVSGHVEITTSGGGGMKAVVEINGGESCARVSEGRTVIPFKIKDARLWYPNGEGEAFLYDMDIRLEDSGVIDSRHHRIGFRTIKVIRDDRVDGKGKRFLFKVNGREIFCRGYNWVPLDNSIPRNYGERLKRILDLAQKGNVNMLRVWGGGYYEDDEFYRMCDERGIMVWQDNMFACSLYPDTDKHFMKLVKEELICNIKRLRNFTSLVLWCGENETHWGYEEWGWSKKFPRYYGKEIYDKLSPFLIQDLDPDRFYWNGSPYSEEQGVLANDQYHGDTHFWILHSNCEDFSGYLKSEASFISETGLQSFPDLRTSLAMGDDEDRNIQSFIFDTRNHYERPAKNERLIKFITSLFRINDNFERMVILSNLAHAEYLKYALEHWRSMAYDCAGVLVWQLNDCWPAISWSAIDYNLIPKACYYYMKRAFEVDMVGFKQKYSPTYDPEINCRGDLFVASEREGAKQGMLEFKIVRIDGEVIETRVFPIRLNGRGTIYLGEIALSDYRMRRFDCVAEFTLKWDDGKMARNIYTFSRPKHMKLLKPKIELLQKAPDKVIIKTDIYAKGVYLFHPDIKVIFEDNYFDLMPGEERLVSTSNPVQLVDIKIFSYHH